MKRLITLALFCPLISFGQSFDISYLEGYRTTKGTEIKNRFSDEILVGYHVTKHFEVSAFDELTLWGRDVNTIGAAADVLTKFFYAGVSVKAAKPGNLYYTKPVEVIKYETAPGCDVHAGSKQKIWKNLSAIEQAAYSIMEIRAHAYSPDHGDLYNGTQAVSGCLKYCSVHVGLSYGL